MYYATLYVAAVLGCIVLDVRTGIRRPLLAVTFPLLVLDCAANCLVFWQSWRNTMSGEADHHREHPLFFWVADFVDALFFWQDDHCRRQAMRERMYGGFWPAYVADWKRSK